ncbi:MAG: DMT family transporter [Acidimicrobiales bacterium]
MRRLAPALFVVLWSTGFVVARYATDDAGAFSFLVVRTLVAAVVLAVVSRAVHEPSLDGGAIRTQALVGVGIHAMYLGGVFYAIEHGMPSGISALIAALHPVLTALLAWVVLGEALRPVRVAGVVLGFAGVVFVVAERGGTGVSVPADALAGMAVAVAGMSAGTLLQRRHGGQVPLLRGTAVQYLATAAVLAVPAVAGEGWRFGSTASTWWALAWAVGVLSIAAILTMLWLLRNRAASQVSSLFFLTPALSTIESAVLFGEEVGALTVAGLVVGSAGVWLATASRFAPSAVAVSTPPR